MKKQRLSISVLIAMLAICQILPTMAAPALKVPSVLKNASVSKAAAGSTVREHPVIKPIPGSVFKPTMSKNFNYHTYKFQLGPSKYEEVFGPYWELYYYFPGADGKPDKNISYIEIQENFRRAALECGGEILYKSLYRTNFTLINNGKKYWVHVAAATPGQYRLYIIEQKDFNQTLAFDADGIKKQLYSTGRVAIHNIKFDYDEDAILPESEAALAEIVKLLQEDSSMRIEIQGHTDNQGDRFYNVELSKRRADAVRDYLIGAGISSYRLETRGVGPDDPMYSNDTEENRSQNRRVELKRIL